MKTIQDMRNGLTLSFWSDSYIGSPTEGYRRVCLRMSWTGKWSFFPEIWPGCDIPFFQRFKEIDLKTSHPKPGSYTENPPPLSHLQQALVSPQASVSMETLMTRKSCRTLALQPSRWTSRRLKEEENEHLLGKGFKVPWWAVGLAVGAVLRWEHNTLQPRADERTEQNTPWRLQLASNSVHFQVGSCYHPASNRPLKDPLSPAFIWIHWGCVLTWTAKPKESPAPSHFAMLSLDRTG